MPSNASPIGPPKSPDVPIVYVGPTTPVAAVTFVTVPSPEFATHTFVPSNATPWGLEPTFTVRTSAPVDARSSVTVCEPEFAIHTFVPSNTTPAGVGPTLNALLAWVRAVSSRDLGRACVGDPDARAVEGQPGRCRARRERAGGRAGLGVERRDRVVGRVRDPHLHAVEDDAEARPDASFGNARLASRRWSIASCDGFNPPETTPVAATRLALFAVLFATHMFVPSNATPAGPEPTVTVPSTTPVDAFTLATLAVPESVTHMLDPSNAMPVGAASAPSAMEGPADVPVAAFNRVMLLPPLSATQMLVPSKASADGCSPAANGPVRTPVIVWNRMTLLLPRFATQMYVPSNTNADGDEPTANGPDFKLVLTAIFVTLALPVSRPRWTCRRTPAPPGACRP